MGYPYDTLIPAAILLDNSGLNREELVDLLDLTQSEGIFSSVYHKGLHGLAEILKLSLTEKFKEDGKKHNEEYVKRKSLLIRRKEDTINYEVHLTEYIPLEEKVVKTFHSKYSAGDIGDTWCVCKGCFFKVLEVVSQEEKKEKEVAKNVKTFSIKPDDSGGFSLKQEETLSEEEKEFSYETQVMRVLPFEEKTDIKTFDSLQKLVKEFPEYCPDFMYDWTLNNGKLMAGFSEEFRWIRKDGKYYLDNNFVRENISTGKKRLFDRYDWTDLILTRDAIRTGFWKVLQRRGLDFLEEFLDEHPEARQNYDTASWNSTTSLYAKMKEMTNEDLLRFRLESKIEHIIQIHSE